MMILEYTRIVFTLLRPIPNWEKLAYTPTYISAAMSDTNCANNIDPHALVIRLWGEVIEEKRLRSAGERWNEFFFRK